MSPRVLGLPVCRLALCLLYLLAASAAVAEPAKEPALSFGILPFESPVALFKRFAPLRDHLGHALHREVALETAKDFPEFIERLGARKYDVVLTAPHFALLALDQGRYEVVASHTEPLLTMIVVPEDSPVREPAQLAGLRLATPPDEAIATMVGKGHLEGLGLTGDRALRYQTFRTHNAAFQAALSGQADAAMIANTIFVKAKQSGAKLRVVTQSPAFPGMAILVGKDLPPALRAAIRDNFIALKDHPEGRRLLELITHPGYQAAHAEDFEPLRPYLP